MRTDAIGRKRGGVKLTPNARELAKYLSECCSSPHRNVLELVYEALTMRGRREAKQRSPYSVRAFLPMAEALLAHTPIVEVVGDDEAGAFALTPAEFLTRFAPVWADEYGECRDAWGKSLVGDEYEQMRVVAQFERAESFAQSIEWLGYALYTAEAPSRRAA